MYQVSCLDFILDKKPKYKWNIEKYLLILLWVQLPAFTVLPEHRYSP